MLKAKIINYSNNSVFSAELAPRSTNQALSLICRHPDCDLVLDGPAVSRVHGRLLFDREQCFFTDLGAIQPPLKIWVGEEISARCIQIIQETHDVKTFRFVSEPDQLFDFNPG